MIQMWRFFRTFSVPIVVLFLGPVAAVSGLFMGTWFSEKVAEEDIAPGVYTYAELLWTNTFDFSTPVPFFVFSLIIAFAGAVEIFWNRYTYGENSKLKLRLRDEVQNHGESQRNYFDSLFEALRYMLASDAIGFDDTCRVTIYRLQNNSSEHLKRIFRFSSHHSYNEGGRFQIPIAEGLVGLAWSNHGRIEYEYRGDPEGANDHLRDYMAAWQGRAPSCELSMPSRSFIIRAVEELESRRRVAVVVYESTSNDRLRLETIDNLFAREGIVLCRLIKHLGALDGKLNPDTSGSK